MFNCAGIVGAVGPMENAAAAMEANDIYSFKWCIYGMKHAGRKMKRSETGSIISMSSTAGIMGGLGPNAYCTAKHAVVDMTKNLAAELGAFDLRVNCIAPFGMATPMVANVFWGDHHNLDATVAAMSQGIPAD